MSGASKVVYALWCGEEQSPDLLAKSLLLEAGRRLAAAGATSVQVNVSDDVVAAAMLRLTAFPTPVAAVVSVRLERPCVDEVTSVLVELGYASNPQDLKLLMSDAWRARVTESMTQAVGAFFTTRVAARPPRGGPN